MVTMTFNVFRSRFTSSTMPLKLVNGPALMRTWMDLGRDDLGKPGTHQPDRQLADSERFNQPMAEWFETFLTDWLGERVTSDA